MVVVAMLITVITAILIILIDIIGHLVVVLSYHRLRTMAHWGSKSNTYTTLAGKEIKWVWSQVVVLQAKSSWKLSSPVELLKSEQDCRILRSKLSCALLSLPATLCGLPVLSPNPGHCERRCANLLALVDWGGWQVGQCQANTSVTSIPYDFICIYMCELRSYSPIYIYITMFLQLKSYKIN
jgi:hypothetical protein